MGKRVAVVGAGASGLATVKELLAEGHEPVCFERSAGLGGIFRFAEGDGKVWDSCRLTSSGLLTAFSDFPAPADRLEHMTVGQYTEYLARYAEAFGLLRHMRFETTVERITREGDRWRVRTAAADGSRHEGVYDAVAVCSGVHAVPHRPQWPGLDSFPGTVLHASEYRRPAQLAGQRVLIVGAGESGADIAGEVPDHAAETVLSLRRGVSVIPRRIFDRPNDYLTSRLNNSSAHWVFQTRNPADDWKRHVWRASFFPLLVLDKLLQHASYYLYEELPLWLPRPLAAGRQALAAARVRVRARRELWRLLRESGGGFAEQFGTKSDAFLHQIAAGRLRRAGPIERLDGRTVRFADGRSFEPDVIVLCTGFDTRASFLDDAWVHSERYLHSFLPVVGPSLAFIGFLRPAYGAIPPLAELQARYFALLLSGARALPTEPEMRASIRRLAEFRRHYFHVVKGRLDYLVDFTSFCDELAALIGCKPTWADVRREGRDFVRRFVSGPFVVTQYRLVGPHARPELARAVIRELPVVHPLPMLAAYHLRWALSRILHRLLGPSFATKLVLDPR